MTSEQALFAHGRLAGDADGTAAPAQVLRLLQHAPTLCACIPGAQSVVRQSDGRFAVHVDGAIGPMKTRFDGLFNVTADHQTDRRRIRAEGRSDTSQASLDLAVRVEATDAGCRLVYEGTLEMAGRAAAMGDQLVETVAGMLARVFFERLVEAAGLPGEAPPDDWKPRLGLNPEVWVPGLCLALLGMIFAFRL